MRWCAGVVLAFTVAMLLACPVSADPVTEPIALAGISDVSHDSSSVGFSNSGALLSSDSSGALAGLADPAKLGVITVENSSRVPPMRVGPPHVYAADEEIADAILSGVPAVSESRLWAQSGALVNTAILDLDTNPSNQADALELSTAAAPEPSSLLLLGSGLLGLALILLRRAKATEVTVRN